MKIDDSKISNLLKQTEVSLPEELDIKTTRLILKNPKKRLSFNYIWKVASIPVALVLIFTFILLFPFNDNSIEEGISEIRTEFFIKNKNIKIIWIQRKDFKLNLKKEKK
jgi:hypothetical protein